jgi:adenylosuccinate lyase
MTLPAFRAIARLRPAALVALCAAFLSGGCVSPNALAELQGQLNQAADAVNDIRVNLSIMQETLDSLRTVVAKQDTTIARLANATGVQVVK